MNHLSSLAIDTSNMGKITVKPVKTTIETVMDLARMCLADFQKHQFGDLDFSLSILNSNTTDPRRFYAVRARAATADIVLKINYSGKNRDLFQREALTQQRIHNKFLTETGLHVPKVIHVSTILPFFAMEFVPGQAIHAALRNHVMVEDEDRIFYQTGKWLAKIHQLRALENVAFAPEDARRNLTMRIKGREANAHGIYLATEFDGYYQKLLSFGAGYEGHDNPVVLGHGDFHGDNLVYSNNGCTGLDFYNVRRLSAGLDIARFLVHADLSQYEDPAKIGTLGLVQSHVDAFFDGYGQSPDKDHVFTYFIRLRLLETWSKFPESAGQDDHSRKALDLMVQRVDMAFAD